MNTSEINTSHCKIAIERSSGSGMTVLFIHGNSSCKEIFRNQMRGEIGETFQCVAMDLPGHGKSADAENPEQSYTMSGYADAALHVMDALGLTSFAVVGWSLGGHIGIEMLAQSNAPTALLISGTPPVGTDPVDMGAAFLPSEHMGLTAQEVFTPEEAESYAHATCGGDAYYEEFLGEAVRRTDGRARRIMMEAAMRGEGANQRETVETNPTPLVVVNGMNEPMVNNEYLQTLKYKNLWEDKVHLVPGVGHAPFWEAPEAFDLLLNRFLTGLDAT